MQYDVASPEEYLAALADDWRKSRVMELRAMITGLAPDWREGIEYKMLSYSDKAGSVLHLNAQKTYVAVYVGDIAKVDPLGEMLVGLDLGKGCIRLKKRDNPETVGFLEFLKRLVELRRAGTELGC